MSRIDDAVTRILRVKFALGLMDRRIDFHADRSLEQRFGSAEHRAVARQAVRESMVLLKNEHGALPLSKSARRIHVAGKSADDIGIQSGGWTISWQGEAGNITTGGTTVLSAIRASAGPTTQITYSADGSGAAGADAVVVVVGEPPYAEMKGDRLDLSLDAGDRQRWRMRARRTYRSSSSSSRAVRSTSHRYWATRMRVLAAWLPGTEGGGVADVLFGDYRPTGKLAFTWPSFHRSDGSRRVSRTALSVRVRPHHASRCRKC